MLKEKELTNQLLYGGILLCTINQVEVVAEEEKDPTVVIVEEEHEEKVGLTIEEEVEIIAETEVPTNFCHGLQLTEEWIEKPKHGEDCKEDTTTWNNTKGHPSMPPLLSIIIQEIIDGESRFLEPDEQQQKKKINSKFKVWSKMKEKDEEINLHFCGSNDQLSDIFTKSLGRVTFEFQ